MDRAAALAALNRHLLEAFSRRTSDALRGILPLRVALPRIESFLAINVDKEVRKDALVIRAATQARLAQPRPRDELVARLLQEARAVDREFLADAARFPVRIHIPYARLDPLRRQRIERGLDLAWRVLDGWAAGARLRDALPPAELEQSLRAILLLYAEETQALSHAVQLPGILAGLRERLAPSR